MASDYLALFGFLFAGSGLVLAILDVMLGLDLPLLVTLGVLGARVFVASMSFGETVVTFEVLKEVLVTFEVIEVALVTFEVLVAVAGDFMSVEEVLVTFGVPGASVAVPSSGIGEAVVTSEFSLVTTVSVEEVLFTFGGPEVVLVTFGVLEVVLVTFEVLREVVVTSVTLGADLVISEVLGVNLAERLSRVVLAGADAGQESGFCSDCSFSGFSATAATAACSCSMASAAG